MLTYKDDVDLNKKLEEWERFYNLDRPHGALAEMKHSADQIHLRLLDIL